MCMWFSFFLFFACDENRKTAGIKMLCTWQLLNKILHQELLSCIKWTISFFFPGEYLSNPIGNKKKESTFLLSYQLCLDWVLLQAWTGPCTQKDHPDIILLKCSPQAPKGTLDIDWDHCRFSQRWCLAALGTQNWISPCGPTSLSAPRP